MHSAEPTAQRRLLWTVTSRSMPHPDGITNEGAPTMTTTARTTTPTLRTLWDHLDTAVERVIWADRCTSVGDVNLAGAMWAAAATHITAVEDALDGHEFGDDTAIIEFELDSARSVLVRHLANSAR